MSESARPIYVDYNASTPIDPRVATAMRPLLEGMFRQPVGDPSKRPSRRWVVMARERATLAPNACTSVHVSAAPSLST